MERLCYVAVLNHDELIQLYRERIEISLSGSELEKAKEELKEYIDSNEHMCIVDSFMSLSPFKELRTFNDFIFQDIPSGYKYSQIEDGGSDKFVSDRIMIGFAKSYPDNLYCKKVSAPLFFYHSAEWEKFQKEVNDAKELLKNNFESNLPFITKKPKMLLIDFELYR